MHEVQQRNWEVLGSALDRLRVAGSDVSNNAVVHPLGFVVYPLVQDTLVRLRLHVWDDSRRYTQEPQWPVHNHRFAIRSHVLLGGLINEIYRISEDPTSAQTLFSVDYRGKNSIMHNTHQHVSAVLEGTKRYGTDEFYIIPRGQFHATHVELQSLTATVVFVYDESESAPLVVGEQGYSTLDYHRSHLAASDALYLLKRVQATLKIN